MRSTLLALLLLTVALVAPTPAVAQKKGKEKPPPPVTGPTLTSPFNLGCDGKPATLTLTGTGLADATAVWLSCGGNASVVEADKTGKSLKVKVAPPASAFGLYELRVVTKTGVTNGRPFCVDLLPAVAEADGNGKKASAQKLPNPCVVTGVAAAEASDFFRVPVTAGVPLTVEVLGRRLGSTIDPVILMHDGDGRELASLYADDSPGLQADARLTFTPKSSGDYIVEVRDTTYRGGPEYAYRLRVGNFPSATTAYPVAIQRGQPTTVAFTGPQAKTLKPVKIAATDTPAYAVPRGDSPLPGWPVPVLVADAPQLTEVEPNDTPAAAKAMRLPFGVTGTFEGKQDRDCYRFAVTKGKKYAVTVTTGEINSPAEVLLTLQDAAGKKLAASDPLKPECRVEFTAAIDGDAVAVCEHLNYVAGPNEVYWLQADEARPDFAVTLGADCVAVPAGGEGKVTVTGVTRLNGFAGPIELAVTGDDRLAGKLTIPADAKPTPDKPLTLTVKAKPDAKPGPATLVVTATATVGGKPVTRRGSVADLVRAAFNGLSNPPPELLDRVIGAVVPAAPAKK
jgi:hypothetical protein